MNGTSSETIESQTRPSALHSELSNQVEESRRREAAAVFDFMACAVIVLVCTHSVPQTVRDEDMSDPSHVSQAQKREGDDKEPTKNPASLKANRSQTRAWTRCWQ